MYLILQSIEMSVKILKDFKSFVKKIKLSAFSLLNEKTQEMRE